MSASTESGVYPPPGGTGLPPSLKLREDKTSSAKNNIQERSPAPIEHDFARGKDRKIMIR